MTTVHLPYGSRQIEVVLDAEVLYLDDGDDRAHERRDTGTIIKTALEHPGGTKRLRELVASNRDAQIVIVVDDHTRATPTVLMLDALMEEIGYEFHDQITLLVACGTHEPPTEADVKRILGSYVGDYTIKIHDSDALDLVYVGTTSRGTPVKLNRNYVEADIKILTGDITLHYYAGFGGGRKSILPGIAARETIQKNHALLIDEQARTANLDRNPVHLDMSEAAAFCPPDFVLNVVVAGSGALQAAYAGALTDVFYRGCELAKGMFCQETPELFDVLIVSAGGFPKDRNLYQASKALENCYRAVVPGGTLIFVAECREGIGDPHFDAWMVAYPTVEAAEDAIRSRFVLGGHKAYYLRKLMTRVSLSVVSQLDPELLHRWGITSNESLDAALETQKKDKVKIGIVKKGADTLLVPVVKEYIEKRTE